MSESFSVDLERLLELMAGGRLDVQGQFIWGSNSTFLARVAGDDLEAAVVYKPCAGERPLWDFDQATLCRREVAAYVLSTYLGWPAVPPTILRDGPRGVGSVQLYIDADHDEHFFSLREAGGHERAFQEIALFDALANNADRKGGHCLLGRDRQIWAIDHGLTFNTEPKLRTVIWDYAGRAIPSEWLHDLQELSTQFEPDQPLQQALSLLISEPELEALRQRAMNLLESGRFPLPGPGRNVPYPLV